MKRLVQLSLASLLTSFFTASLAFGYSLTTTETTGKIYTADELSSFATTGADMAGMSVTVYYNDDSYETASWLANADGISGGVTGTGFSLYESGDTWNDDSDWILTSTGDAGIIGFSLNGASGDTAFDNDYDNIGTANSSWGYEFYLVSTGEGTVDVTYSNALALTGYAPVGDLFTLLEVKFYDTDGAALALDTFVFQQDTDNSVGHINPTPEPLSMLLFGTGIAGLVGTRVRRKRK